MHAFEAADASAATAKSSIYALEQALLEANRRLVEAGQQQVYSADFIMSHAGSAATQGKVCVSVCDIRSAGALAMLYLPRSCLHPRLLHPA